MMDVEESEKESKKKDIHSDFDGRVKREGVVCSGQGRWLLPMAIGASFLLGV